MYQHNTSSWNLDRCNEVRKHTSGATVVLPGPLYIANKWTKKKKKHFTTHNDLLHNAGIILRIEF